MEYLAHVRKDGESWEIHHLEDHLLSVAELCKQFTDTFGVGSIGYLIGLWHDLGKYKDEFQERIGIKSGYDEEAYLEGKTAKSVKHAITGGLFAMDTLKQVGLVLAFPIIGHHTGLKDFEDLKLSLQELKEIEALFKLKKYIPDHILDVKIEQNKLAFKDKTLFIRMLFSSLVDADRLDTEKFMNPESFKLRTISNSQSIFIEMDKKLDLHLEKLEMDSEKTSVNQLRNEILKTVQSKSSLSSGFFTLTVPTGGGKTLSSLSFALKHTIQHKKSRIIYGIPYISIIEQNAEVFKNILGAENVLEHHSSIELDKDNENSRNRLLTENWDHPLIVTTNVQLFESLFSSKTSRVRKIHNIINSVIILDEAQMIPPDYLQPILNCLKELVEYYHVTVILCTATQPAFNTVQTMNYHLKGIDNSTELAPDPIQLHKQLKRVQVYKPVHEESSWDEISDQVQEQKQALVIVNRKDDAYKLFQMLSGNKYHLSTNMCAEHRTDILNRIKGDLKNKVQVYVVSTQLIEAGVDIDFPVVFRAMTGLDSIAQAAGRCNREGKRDKLGDVFVFEPIQKSPSGHLKQAENAGRVCLNQFDETLQPDAYKKYFEELFWIKGEKGLDKKEIENHLKPNMKFKEISDEFQLIDDFTFPVIVPYKKGKEIIEKMKYSIDYKLLRQSQRYIVNIRSDAYKILKTKKLIREIDNTISILEIESLYNETTGLYWKELPAESFIF